MIFIDNLSLKSCYLAFKLVRSKKNMGNVDYIQVLDPIKKNLYTWFLLKGMRICGINISEAKFYAGHLYIDGENIWQKAQVALNEIALIAAKKSLEK